MTPAAWLERGLAELGLKLSAVQFNTLLGYHAGLVKWNQAFNLTAVRDPEQMMIRHILDSLSLVPWVRPGRLLDVGTGAGLPGVVLAVVCPDLQVTCVDGNGKKIRFIRQMAMELKLNSVTPVQARAEDFTGSFDQITSRALATLADMIGWTEHLLAPNGEWLAMKGQYPQAEIAALPAAIVVREVVPLKVPGLVAERHCVRMVRE